jgi:hypothetical protein
VHVVLGVVVWDIAVVVVVVVLVVVQQKPTASGESATSPDLQFHALSPTR